VNSTLPPPPSPTPTPARALPFERIAYALIAILTAGAFSFPPVPQAQSYHLFADAHALWGIPNALNVLSNAAFLAVGLYGLLRRPRFALGRDVLLGLVTFLVGLVLICAGSAYYHWAPSDEALLWDRLPMSLAFLGVSFSLIAAQSRLRAPFVLFVTLEAAGVAATLYGHLAQDLRFYAMCQALPLLLALASAARLWSVAAARPRARDLLLGFGAYGLAKAAEHFDRALYALTAEGVSGHTLKHLLAAVGAFFVLRCFLYLKPADAQPAPQGAARA